jgi:isovaleryl-CoA dehydrogenase
MDFALGETADAIRETTARFAADKIAPLAAQIDETNEFPRGLWVPRWATLGLHGITVEEEYRRLLASAISSTCVAMEEVSRASASGRPVSYGAHSNLCVNQIRPATHRGSEESATCPSSISGEHVGSLAMSEAGSGSDVVSDEAAGRAARRPLRPERHEVLDHQRALPTPWWSTRRPILRRQPRHHGLHRREGHERLHPVSKKLDKMGMRGSDTAELVFEDCEIPEENIMGPVGGGVGVLMSGLDYERAVLSAGPLGIMQACLDIVLPYVRDRKQFGQAIGSFQLMQGKIADMYVALNSARAYVYAVARACDAGKTTRYDAAGAILLASENAVKVSLEAIQALGGAGYTKEWPVERLLRDAKLYDIGAGTNEIRRFLIGRELIGA